MTEKDLLVKLHNLKNIKPDRAWADSSREILLSQIGQGETLEPVGKFYLLKEIFSLRSLDWFTQPVAFVVLILLSVFVGGTYSLRAARDTKPGDSLYIAKIISEKTQQAITFNEKEKAKLGLEFATNRAKEMAQVMDETNNASNKNAQVSQLADEFRKEISSAQARLDKISNGKHDVNSKKQGADKTTPANVANTATDANSDGGDEDQVFSADSGKDNKGMKISDNASKTGTDVPAVADVNDPKKTLDEAVKLLDNKDINGTLSKLEEAAKIINKEGEVKGESESATTTADAKATTTK